MEILCRSMGILLLAGFVQSATGADFTDVTAETGLTGKLGYRVSVADLDGDGYPDLLLHRQCSHGTGDVLNKQFLYLNVPGDNPEDPFSRKFIDFTSESGIRADRGGTGLGRQSDGAIMADADNDGDLDIFFFVYVHESYDLQEGTNDLMLNDGDAHFTFAPSSPFHLEPIHNTAGVVFLDYDNDGNVDVSIGNWFWNGQPTYQQIYRGYGDGTFTNESASTGIGTQPMVVYSLAAFDADNDGFTDLFAPLYDYLNPALACIHWRNNGDGTFTQHQDISHYSDNCGWLSWVASFGTMPRDYDNDGDIDFNTIYVHGGSDRGMYSGPARNDSGIFTFDWSRVRDRGTEDPDTAHDGDHHASWLDYDGDMLSDFLITECFYDNNRLYLFRQDTDHTFYPVTVATGLDGVNQVNEETNNVIPLDYDLDGDEDILVGFGDDTTGVQLWRNEVGSLAGFVSIVLEGGSAAGTANRSAIGARIEVDASGVTQTREVGAGTGHMGPMAPLRQTFGLDGATLVDSIRVRWPNPALTVKEWKYVPADSFLRLQEVCDLPPEPVHLRVDKDGFDAVLTWEDPAVPEMRWNVYRDAEPDPSAWEAPRAVWTEDADPGTAGIQYRDGGALSEDPSFYYLVSAVDDCGESLRP